MFQPTGSRCIHFLTCIGKFARFMAAIFVFAPMCWAQLPQAGDTTSPPTPGVGHDYVHAPAETVNPANGSVSIRIPVRVASGRELTIPFSIAYDSSGAFYYGTGPGMASPGYGTIKNVPFSQGGWSYTVPLLTFQQETWIVPENGRNFTCTEDVNYVFQDPTGNRHDLGLAVFDDKVSWENYCGGSGISILQGGDGPISAATSDWAEPIIVTDGNGTVYTFGTLPSTVTDRNGNELSFTSTASSVSIKDTAGRTAVSVPTFGSNPDDITVSGLTSPAYKVSWTTASASFSIDVDNLSGSAACPTSLSNSAPAVSAVALPNGQSFTFSYDPTYGMLTKMIYPSGGYVRYVWGKNLQSEAGEWPQGTTGFWDCRYDFPAVTDRYVSFDGSTEVLHQHFAYTTSWQSGIDQYTSKTTTVTTYDLVRGTNFETVYTYTPAKGDCQPDLSGNTNNTGCVGRYTQQVPLEQTIQYYDTTGSLLKTVKKGWSDTTASPNNRPIIASEQTTLSNGQSSLAIYCYNNSQEVTEKDEYDLGTSTITAPSCSSGVPSGTAAGGLLRKTDTAYATFSGAHIVDLPSSEITYNGSGTRMAETDSSYDQTGLQTTSVVQHTTAPGGSARGNLTTVTKQCFNGTCSGGNAVTKYSYFDTGQIYQMTDPNSNVTTFSYTDSYSSCSGNGPPSGSTNAYLTQVTYPAVNVSHIESYCYDYLAGLLKGSTDENSQTTTYTYADSLDRLTQANYPDGGETLVSYNDTPPTPSVTVEKERTSGQYITNVTITDGIGLPTETELTSDPAGTDLTLVSYDGLGRKYTVTNPYRSASDPTYGVTTYTYDALDRTTQVNDPDGSTVGTVYSSNCTTVTDEAGKNRESCTDGLGRVTGVTENPGGLGYGTTYTFDALSNLTEIVQNASRQRNFSYDSLSRLTQSVNPESGTINYAYDPNGNLISRIAPLENQTGSSTVTTSYVYDGLNRLTNKSYSDGTPGPEYFYDRSNPFGFSVANPIGRMVAEWNGTSSWAAWEAFSFDVMGRIIADQQCVPPAVGSNACGQAFTTNQTYDLAGNMTSYTNGQNVTFTQTFNNAAQLTEVTSSYIDSQHPGTLAVFNTYSPFGAVTNTSYGNGLTEARAFNNRLQICRANMNSSGTALSTCTAAIPSGNLLDLNNSWNAGTSDNGNVAEVIATGNQTFNRSFTYDALNRISTMSDSDTVASCQGLSWGYDAWANRTAQTPTKGTCGMWSSTFTGNNQISGYSYDAAGNLLSDGVHTYSYDAENRIISVDGGSTATYFYDAEGRRAEKSVGSTATSFVYDLSSRVIADYQTPPGGWWAGYVYANGKLIAEYYNTTTFFMQTGHRSSSRLMTAMNQSTYDSMDFLPFGEQIQGASGTTHKFSSKERDGETNLDDFGARYYSSQLGRFMSVDWSSVPEAVPYANLTNPQTLNLYAIVGDNPETFADLDGHTCGSIGDNDRNGCAKENSQTTNTGGNDPDPHANNGTGTPNSTTQQKQQPQQQNQPQNPQQSKPPLPPGANPPQQAAKYKTQPQTTEKPTPPRDTPNPTDPPPQVVPGQYNRAPMGTSPETTPAPNPEYMTTGQKIIYGATTFIRAFVDIFGRGAGFFLISTRPSNCAYCAPSQDGGS